MLLYEYQWRLSRAHQSALDEVLRFALFLRTTPQRLWRDERGSDANGQQVYGRHLACTFAFAARLIFQARQAAAARAGAALSRCSATCQAKRPGTTGSPRFQRHCRSVGYQGTGWTLAPDGTHLTCTDGCGRGRVTPLGTRDPATLPVEQIQRVRLFCRADGHNASHVLPAERHLTHEPTGQVMGLEVGLPVYVMDSEEQSVANPR